MSTYNGYTGHLFEEEVLGRCRVKHCGYMKYRDAMQQVRKSQPPKSQFAKNLERRVSRSLGGKVVFYTAVRSTLDTFHGVDAFMEFQGQVVTIDLTMNPHKDSGKADLIVDEEEVKHLSALAGRISREFGSQQKRGIYGH